MPFMNNEIYIIKCFCKYFDMKCQLDSTDSEIYLSKKINVKMMYLLNWPSIFSVFPSFCLLHCLILVLSAVYDQLE